MTPFSMDTVHDTKNNYSMIFVPLKIKFVHLGSLGYITVFSDFQTILMERTRPCSGSLLGEKLKVREIRSLAYVRPHFCRTTFEVRVFGDVRKYDVHFLVMKPSLGGSNFGFRR